MLTIGYAAQSAQSPLAPYSFERRELRPNDVAMEILYCGICHTDLHQARNDWGVSQYPLVPGHEIVGRVTAVGSAVTRHAVGDAVAVGCMVDSCLECDQCRKGEEQLCRKGNTQTYNSRDRVTGERTYGGYSKHLVVREEFVLRVPAGLDLARTAPLLCAGITTYSPLRTWNIGPGSRVGVLGLGGLGHMAVKFGAALGASVTVMSRTADKADDAARLGADAFLVTTDRKAMAASGSRFDLIIDTVPVRHDLTPCLPLLDVDGTLVIVGQVGPIPETLSMPLLMGRRRIAGSPIGGIAETQEMLDYCARAGVLPDCEMIPMDGINAAFERMERADVRYRFVIDMASLSGGG
ncbi:MAG: NAD(P)-dependent alcohol dehydrogenase [Steroidobacteraceae bacterium]